MLLMRQIEEGLREQRARGQTRIRAEFLALESAARFRLDETVVAIAEELCRDAKRLHASASFMFLPAPVTWIEWGIGDQAGAVHAIVDDTLQRGRLWVIERHEDELLPFCFGFDLRERTILFEDPREPAWRQRERLASSSVWFGGIDWPIVGLRLLAVLAILNTPKLYRLRRCEVAKLNQARARRGKWPLLAYDEVVIDLSKVAAVSEPSGSGPPRALHFVRAHMRVRLGKVELVRPHWRGDAQYGVKRPAYVVTNR